MLDEINRGTYYKLTDEDRECITKYFNELNLKRLIGFCDALVQVASYASWRNAELYLKDVGEEKFFRDCGNCGHTFDCDPKFAINVCGNRYVKWIPLTEDQEERLKEN
jgi:hypothetical protein